MPIHPQILFIMRPILILFVSFYFFAVQNALCQNTEIKTFPSGTGWGYEILVDGQRYILQEHIPAIQGIHYFKSEADARRTAGLVTLKIKKNIMPPMVSPEELDSMKVLPAGYKFAPQEKQEKKPVTTTPKDKLNYQPTGK